MSLLTVSNIHKKHQGDFQLRDISFTQQPLQNIAIAGETGSGKTTLMRIIAGLGQADGGEVFFEQARVKGIDEKLMPGHPGIAYLSQHYELNNNYRVEEILAYANKLTEPASEELFAVCQIDHLLKRKTNTLSGGEKQRVALARLLTHTPRLLLLDEPFSNMDFIHKNILKSVVNDVHERLGVTCMLITHDPLDMLSWAHELFIMHHGQIIERGTPHQLYRHTQNAYTAGLLGKYNLLTPELASMLQAPGTTTFLRPEDFIITTADAPASITGAVASTIYYGSHYELLIQLAAQTIVIRTENKDFKKGDAITIKLRAKINR